MQNSIDWMIKLVKQHEMNKKLHSITKEAQKYRTELQIEKVNNDQVSTPTKAAKTCKTEAKEKWIKRTMEKWREKPLHGQYPNRVNEANIDKKMTHRWLYNTGLKGETEGFILAAQDQSLLTKNYQAKIIKTGADPKCRLCNEKVETVDHIVSGCSKLANTEYTIRHDRLGQYLHWNICKHYNIATPQHWYEHHPQTVTEGENVTILWDYNIHTDREIKANRPDIVVKDLHHKTCYLIDMTVPSDRNIAAKEYEKLAKYKDLEIEISKMWLLKTMTIPIVVGALGMLKKGFNKYLDQIPGNSNQYEVQKIALTSTAHILRKFLSI